MFAVGCGIPPNVTKVRPLAERYQTLGDFDPVVVALVYQNEVVRHHADVVDQI